MMSERLGSACFRMVMIVAEQVLDAATRRRHQPKHDAACRYNAEADVVIWLPRNHTLNSLAIRFHCGYLICFTGLVDGFGNPRLFRLASRTIMVRLLGLDGVYTVGRFYEVLSKSVLASH